MKSRTSLNFGQIGPLTTELAALSKNFPSYNGKMVLYATSFIFRGEYRVAKLYRDILRYGDSVLRYVLDSK